MEAANNLSRLLWPQSSRSGQVLIDGRDIVNFEPADLADQIGYVFQNPDLQILGDTVYEEVAYGLANKNASSDPPLTVRCGMP